MLQRFVLPELWGPAHTENVVLYRSGTPQCCGEGEKHREVPQMLLLPLAWLG